MTCARFLCSLLLFSFLPIFAAADTDDIELKSLLEGFESGHTEDDDDAELEALLQEFENNYASKKSAAIVKQTKKRNWDLVSRGSFSGSYNYQHAKPLQNATDYRGLSRLKYKLVPEFKINLNNDWDTFLSANIFYDYAYSINGEQNYTQEVIDTYQSELELRDGYIRGTLTDHLDIKIGRQIVVWGKSDSLRVVDLLNPLDFREPWLADIENLRLPVTMLKTDFYYAAWNLSAILIPEIRFNKMPAFGGDFYLGEDPPLSEIIPENIRNQEFALALNGTFSGWDLSFYAARVYEDLPYQQTQQNATPTLEHSRINMAGGATNLVLGHWLFKSEAALIDNLILSNGKEPFRRFDIMFGVDYAGIQNIIYSVEAVNRRLLNYDLVLQQSPDFIQKNESQIAFRYTGNFFREKLQLVALASLFGPSVDDGAFYRGSAEYEIMDAFSIMIGGIIYQAEKNNSGSMLSKIAQNDRVFFDIKYTL